MKYAIKVWLMSKWVKYKTKIIVANVVPALGYLIYLCLNV